VITTATEAVLVVVFTLLAVVGIAILWAAGSPHHPDEHPIFGAVSCLNALFWYVFGGDAMHGSVTDRGMDALLFTLGLRVLWRWWTRRGRRQLASKLLGYKARALRAKLLVGWRQVTP
jgi:hypothetical protein